MRKYKRKFKHNYCFKLNGETFRLVRIRYYYGDNNGECPNCSFPKVVLNFSDKKTIFGIIYCPNCFNIRIHDFEWSGRIIKIFLVPFIFLCNRIISIDKNKISNGLY